MTDGSHDFTLFDVNNFSSITKFGAMGIDVRAPRRSEGLYYAGHTEGEVSKYAEGSVIDPSISSSGTHKGNRWIGEASYTISGKRGTSGSPVLSADTNNVILLQHGGSGVECGPVFGVRID